MTTTESATTDATGSVGGSPGGTGRFSLGAGLGGALLGSVCCLAPALALAVGFGGAAGLVQLGKYQPFLLAASLLFVGGLNWYSVQRRQRCCTTPEQRRFLYFWPLLSMGVFLVPYLAINNLLVPWLYEVGSRSMAPM